MSPPPICRVHFAGVGGQGVLTAARILGEAACAAGLPVMIGQLHGMAQRGGSVESSVVLGSNRSAFIPMGGAHVVCGFEPLETERALARMSRETLVLMSLGQVVPFLLTERKADYPDPAGILARIRTVAPQVHAIDTAAALAEVGAPRAQGPIMLGALAASGRLPLEPSDVALAIASGSKPAHREANARAFARGSELAAEALSDLTAGTGE